MTATQALLFHPLRVKNDWGYLTFDVGGKPFHGGFWTIKWPDNYVEVIQVMMKSHTVTVWDHGHSSEVTSKVPYVSWLHHGAAVSLRLDQIPGLLIQEKPE